MILVDFGTPRHREMEAMRQFTPKSVARPDIDREKPDETFRVTDETILMPREGTLKQTPGIAPPKLTPNPMGKHRLAHFEEMENTMLNRWSITVAAILTIGMVGTATAEVPTYVVNGLSITPHQLAVLGPAQAEQGLPAATATAGSPHQIAVLTPRRRVAE